MSSVDSLNETRPAGIRATHLRAAIRDAVQELDGYYETLNVHKAIVVVSPGHHRRIARMLVRALKEASFPATCVRSAADALHHIRGCRYRLIVMSVDDYVLVTRDVDACSTCNLVVHLNLDVTADMTTDRRTDKVFRTWASTPCAQSTPVHSKAFVAIACGGAR